MAALLAAIVVSLVSIAVGPVASAATILALDGQWESPVPASVKSGDIVNAVWHVSVNDDGAAPTNVDVPNVTATFTVEHGYFQAIPLSCLTDSTVTPASSISADGMTLVCNLGTQKQGTALRVTTPVIARGVSPDELLVMGSSDGINEVPLDPIPFEPSFGLDMAWGGATNTATTTSRDFVYNWTLFQDEGSVAGPNSITYTISVDSTVAGTWGTSAACQPFSSVAVSGFPWSGGTHPSSQVAPWVGSCTLTRTASNSTVGTATYSMTITGIDYSHTIAPTLDSTGHALPTGKTAVASGQIVVTQATTATVGGVQLSVNAPTYTAAAGTPPLTDVDDSTNNSAYSPWTTGYWSNAWQPWYSGSSANVWSNEYLAGVGATVRQSSGIIFPNTPTPSTITQGVLCNILDTRYVTYSGTTLNTGTGLPLSDLTGVAYWYFTGTGGGLLDPASSLYNPNDWTCGGTGAGWSTTPPADLSTVRAVKAIFNVNAAVRLESAWLYTASTIKSSAPLNQDIWEWGSFAIVRSGVYTWSNPSRSMDPADCPVYGTRTPSLRYPYAAGGRDVVRTAGSTPVVAKTASPASVLAGDTVTYTLQYSASSAAALPNRNGYTLVDTLPAGVTYVAGSANPAPVVSIVAGKQVLTWTINNLPVNTIRTLTYQVTIPSSATSGQSFVNRITATVDGLSSATSATVKVPSDGLTRIAKVSDLAQIPNPTGSGNGASSWTITITSADPRNQTFTDTIDVLPYNGDGRGTNMAGTYALSGAPTVPAGATIYYSTADPTTISLDPAAASNGAAGNPSGNTVGWTTTYTANATAIRVIGGTLAPRATLQITIPYATTGMATGDTLVNTAWARASDTKLDMRTSASITVAPYWAMSLKKYVLASVAADPTLDVSWVDANDPATYPRYQTGDAVQYRVCLTNTGTGVLTNVNITDDLQPTMGAFTVASLAAGAKTCESPYTVIYDSNAAATVVNTASASTTTPYGSLTSSDPAGIYLVNQGVGVVKSSDPVDGSSVMVGASVRYTITFTSTGTSESYVDYTDHLTRVLDDATLDLGSFESSGSVAGAYDAGSQSIRISGYVPAGETVTFSYSVTVNQVDDLGDADLVNVVTPLNVTPPDTCDPDDPLCTEHPVLTPSLTLKKNVVGRSVASDQFTLTVARVVAGAPVTIDSATTSGSATGVQVATATEPRAVPGAVYQISETGAGVTDLATYAATASCSTSAGTDVAVALVGGGNSWELTFPEAVAGATVPETVSCVIANQPKYLVNVDKFGTNCDVHEPTCALPGAQFALYGTDPSVAGAVPLSGALAADALDGSKFTSVGLVPGGYWLVETKAPAGFSLMAEPVHFTVGAGGVTLAESSTSVSVSVDDPFTIEVRDMTAAPLPKAGGEGWTPFLGFGFALMAAAALFLVKTPQLARVRAVGGRGSA